MKPKIKEFLVFETPYCVIKCLVAAEIAITCGLNDPFKYKPLYYEKSLKLSGPFLL